MSSPFNERKYRGLLEGLEASEVMLSKSAENKDFRMDSDFWTKQPKKNPHLQYLKIGDILRLSQYGISVSMNEDNTGYPIYRMNEIHNMLCDLSVDKCADISINEFEKFELKDGDVLFNRTNSFEWVGRTGVYYQNDDIRKTFASYLVRFNPDENIVLPEYLATFLSSKHGVWDVKRRARQSINQTNVNPEEVKEIEIPILPMDFQNEIRNRFEKANKNRVLSQQIYRQAEELLLETIGLKDFKPSEKGTNIKSLKESFLATGRLDAEYYQPKYEEIENAFDKFERIALSRLVFYPISSGITPKAGGDDYTDAENGIPFIRAVDLVNGEVNANNFNYIKSNVHNGILKRTQLKKDDVLFSIAGTVGRCAIFQHNFEANINQAVSILRFEETKVLRLYLLAFFNSFIGKEFVSKYSRQGLQTNLNLEEVGALRVLIIDYEIQRQIAELVGESFRLRSESEGLLEEAKEMVEREIEGSGNNE